MGVKGYAMGSPPWFNSSGLHVIVGRFLARVGGFGRDLGLRVQIFAVSGVTDLGVGGGGLRGGGVYWSPRELPEADQYGRGLDVLTGRVLSRNSGGLFRLVTCRERRGVGFRV